MMHSPLDALPTRADSDNDEGDDDDDGEGDDEVDGDYYEVVDDDEKLDNCTNSVQIKEILKSFAKDILK